MHWVLIVLSLYGNVERSEVFQNAQMCENQRIMAEHAGQKALCVTQGPQQSNNGIDSAARGAGQMLGEGLGQQFGNH